MLGSAMSKTSLSRISGRFPEALWREYLLHVIESALPYTQSWSSVWFLTAQIVSHDQHGWFRGRRNVLMLLILWYRKSEALSVVG